ncbi:conserved hypothetical protein [Trichinella spiralis]|uniref:hypothetical protein n=1 Tax=Trichinella spiralis TaxID=6334 RepID=UPI0001EFC167|nr:conserved hypothetical protein [Trichinella spiralis]
MKILSTFLRENSAVYGRRTVSMPKKKENLLINVIPQCTTLHGLKKLKITASGRRNADSRANELLAGKKVTEILKRVILPYILIVYGYTETMGMHAGQNSIAQILYGTSKVTVAHSYR